MKKIEVTQLKPNTISDCNYYSEKRDLLIGKGTAITDAHLDMLRRRNIFDVFVDVYEHDEILKIISTEIMQLDDLDLEPHTADAPATPVTPGTEPGKEGLEKLGQSKIALMVDRKLTERTLGDLPAGKPLRSEITQVAVGSRSREYKEEIAAVYKSAVDNARMALNAMAEGNAHSTPVIRGLIEKLVSLFKTDRNILLNAAGTCSGDDEYLYHHCLNVSILSINIAAAFGYSEAQVVEIGTGALLHDIGMLMIPRAIRAKHSRLSIDEWYDEVQKHPVIGLHLLEKIKELPESVLYIAYQVHERVNAKGYPKQRGGRLIHRFAKLVQVADIYEALTSPRPHRKALLPYQAAEGLVKMTKTNLVADEFVKAFLSYLSIFPIGSLVQLSNHTVAKVVEARPQSMGKPIVAVLTDVQGRVLPKEKFFHVDLRENTETYIIKALASDYLKGVDLMDGF